MNLQSVSLALYLLFLQTYQSIAQSRSEFQACTRIIAEFCAPLAPTSAYVQINVKLDSGLVLNDIDRGWVLSSSQDTQTILNDRLLIRSYSTRSVRGLSTVFEILPISEEPLSKAEHGLFVAKRTSKQEILMESHQVLNTDFVRYPFFTAEASRLVHILIRSMTEPDINDKLLLLAKDIDFESAYHFPICGCNPFKPPKSWGDNAKCVLANCFLSQVFAKISDSKRVPIDECIEITHKLITMVESKSLECSRQSQLRNVEQSILAWKREKTLVENRIKYFPTPQDVTLDFLMSRGNVPAGERATVFEDDHYVDMRRMWSEKEYVDASEKLSDCELPSRYVVSDRAEGPLILTVGQVLALCGPSKIYKPKK